MSAINAWDAYVARFGESAFSPGSPKRASALDHIQSRMSRKITASLSYKSVLVEGKERQIAIIEDDEFDTKSIFAMPGEDLPHGSLVEWEDSVWLITEINAHKEFCAQGKMRQCNYFLKWIDDSGNVIGKWCIVEDGTKYLIGEKTSDIMSIGDARIAITIGKDADTNRLSRGKRFLVDDPDASDVLAYQITKPNKLFNVYNGRGVFRFILNEVNLTDNDNIEERIADFYNWEPKMARPKPDTKVDLPIEQIVANAKEERENLPNDIEGRKVWL